MYRVYFISMSTNLSANFLNTIPLNTKERVYFKLKMTNLKFLFQNFSNGMPLIFHKLSSLKTPNRLLLIDPDKRTILSKSGKNPAVEFSYDSAHFVNLQVSLELLPDFRLQRSIAPEEQQNCQFKSPLPEAIINDTSSSSSSGIRYGCNVV